MTILASPGQLFIDALHAAGVTLVATLPDAWLGGFIDAAEQDPAIRLVRVTREDEGVGICAGAYLGGARAVLLAQSAGVLLSTNALAGLTIHHQIPLLMIVADRGGIDDDQYYQVYKGRVIAPVLDAVGIPWHRIERTAEIGKIVPAMRQAWLARSPVALLCSRQALRGDGS